MTGMASGSIGSQTPPPQPVGGLVRWTRHVVDHRRSVLAVWIVLMVLGGWATSNLGKLLTNRFSVPGSEAEKGPEHPQVRASTSAATAPSRSSCRSTGAALRPAVAEAAAQRAATKLPDGKAAAAAPGGPRASTTCRSQTPLQAADAKNHTTAMRQAIGTVPGAKTYLTGFPALAHDEQPIYSKDLSKGEIDRGPDRDRRAAVHVRHARRGDRADHLRARDAADDARAGVGDRALRQHRPVRHQHRHADRARDRDRLLDAGRVPLPRGAERRQGRRSSALETTMATAGRATLFSGMTVAIGLAALLLMPLPFMRSMGAGGVLIPLVSMAASVTLLPALLSVLGTRINRLRVMPTGCSSGARAASAGSWSSLARIDHAPPGGLPRGRRRPADRPCDPRLRPARHERRQPRHAARHGGQPNGLLLLECGIGPGPLAPQQVVVRHRPPGRRALARHRRRRAAAGGAQLRADPRIEAATIQAPAAQLRGGRQAGEPDRSRPLRRCRSGRPDAPTPAPRDGRKTSCTRSATPTSRPRASRARDRVLPDGRARVRGRLRRQGLRRVPVAAAGGARDHLLRAAARVPLGRAADQGGADEPALGQRRLRGAGARLPARLGIGSSASTARPRSKPGSRSSCSRRSSGSRWTTRCSCSRACARSGIATTTTSTPSPTGSSTPAASSRRQR